MQTTMDRIKRKHIDRMLRVARLVATWSSCPIGRQHGCVLAKEGKYIVSTGYNGLKTNCEVGRATCASLPKFKMRCVCEATHAEATAFKNLPLLLGPERYRLFAFVTKKPCKDCMLLLREEGIRVVYWEEQDYLGHTIHKGTVKLT